MCPGIRWLRKRKETQINVPGEGCGVSLHSVLESTWESTWERDQENQVGSAPGQLRTECAKASPGEQEAGIFDQTLLPNVLTCFSI